MVFAIALGLPPQKLKQFRPEKNRFPSRDRNGDLRPRRWPHHFDGWEKCMAIEPHASLSTMSATARRVLAGMLSLRKTHRLMLRFSRQKISTGLAKGCCKSRGRTLRLVRAGVAWTWQISQNDSDYSPDSWSVIKMQVLPCFSCPAITYSI
jgi:hypothetical protein